jgi:hypothetical protein
MNEPECLRTINFQGSWFKNFLKDWRTNLRKKGFTLILVCQRIVKQKRWRKYKVITFKSDDRAIEFAKKMRNTVCEFPRFKGEFGFEHNFSISETGFLHIHISLVLTEIYYDRQGETNLFEMLKQIVCLFNDMIGL